MTPTQVVTLGLLAVAWLAIAFPLAMRTRSESLGGTITGFNQAMSVLDPELKAPTVSVASPHRTTQRPQSSTLSLLRRLFAVAVVSTVVLAGAATMWGGVFVPLCALSLVGTGAYVSLLRRRKIEQDRARAVITSIRDHADLAPSRTRERATLPVAVGHTYGRRDLGSSRFDEPGGDAHAYRSDVRLLAGEQRITAYHGFDVVD